MASDNATSIWDVAVALNVAKTTSESEENERVHSNAPEDHDLARVNPILNEDTPPPPETLSIKNPSQISPVPKPNNLFELLIKRVESVNNSAEEVNPPYDSKNLKDNQEKAMDVSSSLSDRTGSSSSQHERNSSNTNSMVTTVELPEPKTNGNMSLTNGESHSEQHEFSEPENEKPNLSSSRRSIFEHLRKNFRIPDDNSRPTAEESSALSESLPMIQKQKDVTSSYYTEMKETEHALSETTSQDKVQMDAAKEEVVIDNKTLTTESHNSIDNFHELDRSDTVNFPFTKRLQWISQRSREGSPSLPQQQQVQSESDLEGMNTIDLCNSSYDLDVAKKPNGISSDSTRTSVITSACTAHSSNQAGFRPLLNNNKQGTPNSGPISLRLHNGKAEMTQVSPTIAMPTLEPVRIPANDEVYYVLDSNRSRVVEMNRTLTSTNVNDRNHLENSCDLLENRQPVYSVVRNPSLANGSGGGVGNNGNRITDNFICLNEQNNAQNDQRMHLRQSTIDFPSTIYSKGPNHSKAFSTMWDRRSIVTSSIPINHRVPTSIPLRYNNVFGASHAFGSPVYRPISHGNPVHYGSQNPLFQQVQIQARQDINFTPGFYSNSVVTAVPPKVGQNLRLSFNEITTNSSPSETVNECVFRPVSPQWPQTNCTNNISSGFNSLAQVTKNEPTISDEDRDEYSYACALHESANSPDIERMLGSESPEEKHCPEIFSINESPVKESKFLISKSSIASLSSCERSTSTSSRIARTSSRLTESSRSIRSEMARPLTKLNESSCSTSLGMVRTSEISPKTDYLTSSRLCSEVVKEGKNDKVKENARDRQKRANESQLTRNDPKEKKNEPTAEQLKKRKPNLNVIHKRLEPKLPSPERETSSGDLYRDPSKLTREERALQRAMMQFNEMEMKEKDAVPSLPKKKRSNHTKEIQKTQTPAVEPKEKLASSTWLLNVKRKQRKWLTSRSKLAKKTSDFVKKDGEETSAVITDPSTDSNETEQNKTTKIKKRKKNKFQNHDDKTSKKRRKLTKERQINPTKQFSEQTAVDPLDAGDQKLDSTNDQLKRKKKKFKKFREKKTEDQEKHNNTTANHNKRDLVIDTPTLTGGNPNMSLSSTAKRKRSVDSSLDRSHCIKRSMDSSLDRSHCVKRSMDSSLDRSHRSVKTYMLVPSYQGFKDFQPVVMTSRTRNKKMTQPDEPVKSNDKPKVPLLVVESVNSRPVKEMVVAESEEVQKLVTECLRVHGKWHGDELEQALKQEEAKLNDEESKLRDAKKLSVNRTTGETILHKAARLGYDEVVKQCILRGADPNARDNAGWTPLHEACARGKLAVVKVLTRFGANVNAPSNDGIRPIHDAAEAGHVNIIRVLLSYGADPMLATYAGNNAFACAKEPKTKKFLQEYCADIGHDNYSESNTNGWEFTCSTSSLDNRERPELVSGIWEDIPDCSDSFSPEFEISDRPHLTTYNLPVLKNGTVVGRRNYLLVQEIYESGQVAKSTLQKKLKNIDTLKMPWSDFLEMIAENHLCSKPSFSPEGSSKEEPEAELIHLNYTIRKVLGIRVEACR